MTFIVFFNVTFIIISTMSTRIKQYLSLSIYMLIIQTPRVKTIFFMLKSTEHEVSTAHIFLNSQPKHFVGTQKNHPKTYIKTDLT